MDIFTYCPVCGQRLPEPVEPPDKLLVQTCPACGTEHWRNAKPCAGALVVRDGRVLLGRRAIEPALGKWDIPGGFLKPWEHPRDGAARELLEETGLQVEPGAICAIVTDTYADQLYTLTVYYFARVLRGEEHPDDDVAELRWFAADELPGEYAFGHSAQVLSAWAASAGAADCSAKR
jgi:ADP-ribose pyrophosphatase YjhB (NUDIX family)